MTTGEKLSEITVELGKIKLDIRDIKISLDGRVLKGFDKFLFKLLGGENK